MAALSAVTRLAARGRIVAGLDLYGGTHRLLTGVCAPLGIEVERVDLTDLAAGERALARPTALVLVESPSNPKLGIVDLRALARLCTARGAVLCVDGSLCPPSYRQPLTLGADLVLHSATKYLCGHGDVTAGTVATRSRELPLLLSFELARDVRVFVHGAAETKGVDELFLGVIGAPHLGGDAPGDGGTIVR